MKAVARVAAQPAAPRALEAHRQQAAPVVLLALAAARAAAPRLRPGVPLHGPPAAAAHRRRAGGGAAGRHRRGYPRGGGGRDLSGRRRRKQPLARLVEKGLVPAETDYN